MPKVSSRRKYKVYDSLRMALRRSKVENPGKVATLLLETFLERNGHLKADMVVEAKLCDKGKFSIWRDNLQKKKFIYFHYEGPGTPHRPGPKLNEYLNREKLTSSEIVVRSDLNQFPRKDEVPTKQEFQDMKERIEALEKAMKIEIQKNDPPYTDEKMEARLSIVKK